MEIDDWRCAYFGGLVDNHCSIVLTVGKDSNRKIGYRLGIECRIKLEAEESTKLLESFCEDYEIEYRTNTKTDTKYTRYETIIGRRNDVRKFLKKTEDYLVSRADAVEILCDNIIPRMDEGDHRNKDSFLELMEDIEEFREKVGRANRAKYDREYFLEEWGDGKSK